MKLTALTFVCVLLVLAGELSDGSPLQKSNRILEVRQAPPSPPSPDDGQPSPGPPPGSRTPPGDEVPDPPPSAGNPEPPPSGGNPKPPHSARNPKPPPSGGKPEPPASGGGAGPPPSGDGDPPIEFGQNGPPLYHVLTRSISEGAPPQMPCCMKHQNRTTEAISTTTEDVAGIEEVTAVAG